MARVTVSVPDSQTQQVVDSQMHQEKYNMLKADYGTLKGEVKSLEQRNQMLLT